MSKSVLDPVDSSVAEAVRNLPREDKVDIVYDMVRGLRWQGRTSARALAKIWRMETHEVTSMHREAQNLIEREIVASGVNLGPELIANLQHVVKSAMENKKPFLTKSGDVVYADAPDHKAAIAGINQLADIAGLKAGKRKITINYSEMTLEQLVSEARKVTTKNEKALPEKHSIPTAGEASDDGDEIIVRGWDDE